MHDTRIDWMNRASVDEFEAELANRTHLPEGADERFRGLPDPQLRTSVREVAHTIRRFAAAVAAAMDETDSAGRFIDSMDLAAISRDHDWRLVFAALRGSGERGRDHRKIALAKYLRYLNSRKQLLEYILSERLALEETSTGEDPTVPSMTVLANLERLVPGETTEVRLPDAGTLPMRLGRHAFRLEPGRPPCLIDEKGQRYPLREGRLKVGRHPESDVRLDRNLIDVSRLHMVIEWAGGDVVRVTDLSSSGTFVDELGLGAGESGA